VANSPIPSPYVSAPIPPAHPAHVVQFYEDDGFLLDHLTKHFLPTLEAGGAAIVVATKLHREGLKTRLKQRGFNVNAAVHEGRYIQLDAAETKERICRNGKVDRSRFREIIGGLVKIAQRENGHTRRVAVFGEIVALLWHEGNRDSVVKLEQLWNELMHERDFSLFCAYPLGGFSRAAHDEALQAVCAEHGCTFPAEGYVSDSDAERGRVVAQLQQKARALETELRLNEERNDLLQAAAGLGTWEIDLVDDSVALSSNAQRMLGLSSTGRITLADLLKVMYYSGDRDAFLAALKKARTGRKEFVAEFRVKTGTDVRVLASDGKVYYNAGQPLLIGVLADVTSNRQDAVAS
jgi:PAS domain-containing protein